MSITLRGITWDHTRGILPLQAAAQRFNELNPDIQIHWDKRSLKGFEDFPIGKLAENYDLLVIDHPFIGEAASKQVFAPLNDLLPNEFLADQSKHSVGQSNASYIWDNRQWALAIDAATPVMAWRDDLLLKHRLSVPATWDEVLDHARAGLVEVPAVAVNCLMQFYALCIACGEPPFLKSDRVVDHAVGSMALAALLELQQAAGLDALDRNPIVSLERVASAEDKKIFCLFPYGYSNYSRDGYAAHSLTFGDVPSFDGKSRMTTTLGGTGLAISAQSKQIATAARFAAFAASAQFQRTLYCEAGGQPGHRLAWLDDANNARTRNYFRNTLPTLDRAFLRPRYAGYLHGFQELAGPVIRDHILQKLTATDALNAIDTLYRTSQEGHS